MIEHDARPAALSPPALEEAALLAHQFRGPVAGIQTTAEALARGAYGSITPVQAEAVASIALRCRRLEATMDAISELHALEAGRQPRQRQPVDVVADVIAPVVAEVRRRANGEPARLTIDAGEAVVAWADARLVGIVVENLVDNAIKYGAPGAEVRVGARRDGNRVVIRVRNEGVGIAPADCDRLFRPFGRLRQPGTEGVVGAGLGLYLCRRIVEALDGSIAAHSVPGGTTEFAFDLAACDPDR